MNEDGVKAKKDFDYWIALALDFNKRAKASKKKNRSGGHRKGRSLAEADV